jgi:hypothetical protein
MQTTSHAARLLRGDFGICGRGVVHRWPMRAEICGARVHGLSIQRFVSSGRLAVGSIGGWMYQKAKVGRDGGGPQGGHLPPSASGVESGQIPGPSAPDNAVGRSANTCSHPRQSSNAVAFRQSAGDRRRSLGLTANHPLDRTLVRRRLVERLGGRAQRRIEPKGRRGGCL